MYVYMFTCTHVCVCTYVCMCLYTCMYVCMLCIHVYMHIYINACIHVCACTYVYACTYVCTVYMHVHMYVHVWMYTMCMFKYAFPPNITSSTRGSIVFQRSCSDEVTGDQNGMYSCLQLQALRKGYVNNPVLPRQ